ncbi:MAG: monovalent cation/H(+) antiporter subunit G [Anaerolineae bacterium]|nr:monovalent cation/H(+) antiporter subunit G [Thermoflexus sp.]MDW8065437.1 monovalent cation/H(+) antiporter subunit G [Anaerolineae bacterium]
MKEIVSLVLIAIGAALMLIAGIGLLRMPDLYTRMSAATKATTMGVGSILLAAAVHFSEPAIAARALAVIAFALLTSPVAAHMIGRAAYFTGVPLWKGTVINELRGRYDPRTHALESIRFPELERRLADLQVYRLRVPAESVVIGKTLAEIELRKRYNVTLLAIFRGPHVIANPEGDVQLLAGDELILIGSHERLREAVDLIYQSS